MVQQKVLQKALLLMGIQFHLIIADFLMEQHFQVEQQQMFHIQ